MTLRNFLTDLMLVSILAAGFLLLTAAMPTCNRIDAANMADRHEQEYLQLEKVTQDRLAACDAKKDRLEQIGAPDWAFKQLAQVRQNVCDTFLANREALQKTQGQETARMAKRILAE